MQEIRNTYSLKSDLENMQWLVLKLVQNVL